MNNSNYDNIKRKLEKIKEQNIEQITLIDERFRMSKVNGLEYKFLTTSFFSMISYLVLFGISLGVTHIFGSNVIASIFPGVSYPFVFLGSSLGLGILDRSLLDKKYKTKERLKNFSDARNQVEKLKEEIIYEIELEKVNNRNRVIDEAMKIVDSNKKMIDGFSNKYDIKKNIDSNKMLLEKEENLSSILMDGYENLDILSTKKVLHDRFWRVRENFYRRTGTLIVPMLSIFLTMLALGFPMMLINDVMVSSSSLTDSWIFFSSFLVSATGTSLYMLKRNSDYKKVFNKLNLSLLENDMDEKLTDVDSAVLEEQKINDLIESQVMNLGMALVQFQENKMYLDSYKEEDDEKEDALELSSENFCESLTNDFDKENISVKKKTLKKR